MVHNQIHVPLCKELKGSSLRKNHAEHRVDLLDAAFLAAPHRITVIDTGTLDSLNPGFKIVRPAEFRAPVRQDIVEQGQEFIGT